MLCMTEIVLEDFGLLLMMSDHVWLILGSTMLWKDTTKYDPQSELSNGCESFLNHGNESIILAIRVMNILTQFLITRLYLPYKHAATYIAFISRVSLGIFNSSVESAPAIPNAAIEISIQFFILCQRIYPKPMHTMHHRIPVVLTMKCLSSPLNEN